MGRRRWSWVDSVLVLSWVPAALAVTISRLSIPVEETHGIGNDAPFDRLVILTMTIWVLASIMILLLRRLPHGLRAQWRAERRLWQEMRAAERDRPPTGS